MLIALVTGALLPSQPRFSAARVHMAVEVERLRGALDEVMPSLSPRLSLLGINSTGLVEHLQMLPADDRDEMLLAATVRCASPTRDGLERPELHSVTVDAPAIAGLRPPSTWFSL